MLNHLQSENSNTGCLATSWEANVWALVPSPCGAVAYGRAGSVDLPAPDAFIALVQGIPSSRWPSHCCHNFP